jgi:hypothetical protein
MIQAKKGFLLATFHAFFHSGNSQAFVTQRVLGVGDCCTVTLGTMTHVQYESFW